MQIVYAKQLQVYILGLSHRISLLPRRFVERLGARDPDTLSCDPGRRRPCELPADVLSLRHMNTDSIQIAVERAIPYQEFKKNPHTVCLTTSLGGHLAFFEVGGGRWHAKPVGLT